MSNIRMVHPQDPKATASGYSKHPKGGIVVPEDEEALLKSHGFRRENEDEIGARATEWQERQKRIEARRREREIDAALDG